MRNLLYTLILCIFLPGFTWAQTVVYGNIRNEEGIPNELIQIRVDNSPTRNLSTVEGTYSLLVPEGRHILYFGSYYKYFVQEHTLETTGKDSIRLDILLELATPQRLMERIPKGSFPPALWGEWKIKSIESIEEGEVPVVLAGLFIHINKQENGLPMLSYGDQCRGYHHQYYLHASAADSLRFYSTYRPLSHTCELRPCDRRHSFEKNLGSRIFASLRDGESVSYYLSEDQRHLLLYIGDNIIALRKKI